MSIITAKNSARDGRSTEEQQTRVPVHKEQDVIHRRERERERKKKKEPESLTFMCIQKRGFLQYYCKLCDHSLATL
jgi:hypothetical protein